MILNMSGGGGTSLNFKIVGGKTQPENPKANTIWVDTDLDIVNYIFGCDTPSELALGTTWFQIGNAGKAKFNILKKNVIELNLAACKQYIGDKLTSMNAWIYQNGEWIKFSADWSGELFDNGNQYEDVTGGWIYGAETVTDTTLKASVWSQSSYSPVVRTVNKIDITDFSTLHVELSSVTRGMAFGLVETDATNIVWSNFIGGSGSASAAGSYTLDISAQSGKYYIVLVAGAGNNAEFAFTATKVWLS